MTGTSEDANSDAAGADASALKDDPLVSQLRAMYEDVAAEPLPDDLMKLLDKLDQVERTR